MKKKYTIEDMHALADKKRGKCLSSEYVDSHTKLRWECVRGHQWSAKPSNIIHRNSWCPNCGAKKGVKKVLLGIGTMQTLAAKHGGKCLAEKYENNKTHLEWECAERHRWHAVPQDIKNKGVWCPYCGRKYISEEFCRQVFQFIFKKDFRRARPKWNRNEAGKRLELDGLAEEISIAFEHHGLHHYKLDGFFNRTKKQLEKRIENDQAKRHNCLSENIKLVEISQINIYDHEEALNQVLSAIRSVDISIPPFTREDLIKSIKTIAANIIQRLKTLAEDRGGKLLSEGFISANTPLKWECDKGHRWNATPYRVEVENRWCPKCSRKKAGIRRRDTIENMHSLAEKRRGRCLSTEYVNRSTKLRWECTKGHQWSAVPGDVKGTKNRKGTWCPDCFSADRSKSLRGTIEEMNALAAKRCGKCLSEKYENSTVPLEWECVEGHRWPAAAGQVKGTKNREGTWCPLCAKQIRAEVFRNIANKRKATRAKAFHQL